MALLAPLRAIAGGLVLFCSASLLAQSSNSTLTNGNRLTYLDDSDPFYPGLNFPKLTTPQWVGEPGVEAVVILAIDDMKEAKKYAAYLRPILERLKQIDGRAPLSIMCNTNNVDDPLLAPWLKEGVSLEVHTMSHPCPLLARGNFQAAAETYHRCVELLNGISNNTPVAFRTPCCDSINSPSPRVYAELFNSTNSLGQFLTIDSSVMNIPTSADSELPRELAVQGDGTERFRKYIPFPSFVTTIENYPYPYVIGRLCWQFPAMVPSDWEAKNLHNTNNPVTLADWKKALDIAVVKKGVFTFIFHPHGWMRPDQHVEFIDYAVSKYGKRVKFLNFKEAAERLNTNLLAGTPLRDPHGQDNGVRLMDLNNDGFLDVMIGSQQRTRIWNPKTSQWRETKLPMVIDPQTRFGVGSKGDVVAISRRAPEGGALALRFHEDAWSAEPALLNGLEVDGQPVVTSADVTAPSLNGRDRGVRLRDIDNDGQCELIVGNESQSAIFSWSDTDQRWKRAPYNLPLDTAIADAEGRDAGLRFVDLNEDGYADVLFSNERRYSLHLFRPVADTRLFLAMGWTDEVISAARSDEPEVTQIIPMIVRGGAHPNNGVWFHSSSMWVQNEDTSNLPDYVDRRSFRQLLTCDQPEALSPEKALASMKAQPGFKVELVASEPMVIDPIAFEWGADGRLWVVEATDYPLGIDGKGKPGGRVRFLEDTDDDGRYDKSTLFLDNLNFTTGVMPWRKGVIVCSAPEIFYAEDTDNDGKADVRKTLFTGFTPGNQQHRANGFDYGLDNWLYGANGDSGGSVRGVASLLPSLLGEGKQNASPLNLRGHDFRIDPDGGRIEAVSGQTQYGRHRNDWGDWFGNNNPTWLWHYYLPEHYLGRNPNLAVKSTKRVLANYPESNRAFPISRTLTRFNDPGAANHTTSANSATPYRDDLFGPEFRNSVFISEPVHNLVHREVLEPDGVSFKSHRAKDEQDSEFLASSDNWFRPTMLKTGPDGALYIADMYRLVIEHPEWIPASMQKRLDLRAGSDKGRIYRVVPQRAELRPIPRLDKAAVRDLVAALDSPNGWQRDTAQRLLVHAEDHQAIAPLKELFLTSRHAPTRLQALAALDGLKAVTALEVRRGLNDAHYAVRRLALQLAEPILREIPREPNSASSDQALLLSEITGLADDPNAFVRYQAAFTLGECKSPMAARALLRLAQRDAKTPEMLTAVLSSAQPHAKTMLAELLDPKLQKTEPGPVLGALLTSTSVSADREAVTKTLARISQPRAGRFASWQYRALSGLIDGLERQGQSLVEFLKANKAAGDMGPMFRAARETAANSQSAAADRIAALSVLGHVPSEAKADFDILGQLLAPQNAAPLQEAAFETLKKSPDSSVVTVLLTNWRALGPNIRVETLNLFGSRAEWLRRFLDAIEAGGISGGEIGAVAQQKLLTHPDLAIRARAEKLFSTTRSDRRALVRQYLATITGTGDSANGAALFRQNCAVCHRLRGEGNEIGPDLGMVIGKPNEALVAAILDPNQAVESRYISYNVTTKKGRELSGIISGETGTSITLRTQGGTEEVLLRGDIKEISSSGLSLMPEGLEKAVPPEAMADLLAYLRSR